MGTNHQGAAVLSSVQIAQIMQQQNASFMGAATHAQMISQQMPQPMGGGLGAYGGGGGGGHPGGQIPFTANQSRGFSYGMPYSQGYGMGNDIAARGMAAAGAWGSAGIGIGTTAIGMAFPPAAIPLMAVSAVGKHVMGSMVTGAQEQSGVNRVLGQMQFMNAGSRTGRGFSRQDAQQIGSTIREMQHLPEAMTSMGELTRVMDKVIQTGQMQGVRDPQEFQRKFRSTVKTLKEVAQIMGTTMEEAIPLMQEARQAGHYGQAGAKQFSMQRQMSSAMTGMTQQQVNQTAQMGAQMGFQTGGSRATGSKHAMRATNQIGMMNQMGLLSNDEIAELTGKEGAEGIQEMGANMTQMAYRMRHSSIGTIMTVGMGEMKNGRFTGKMDQSLVKRMRQGTLDWSELRERTNKNIASRGAKISYVAKKGQMFSEMAGEAGIEGLSMMLQNVLGDRGYKDEDVFNIVQQRFGASEREAQQVTKMMKALPRIQMEKASMEAQETGRMAQQQAMQKMSPEAIKKRISKKIENVTTEPFKEWGVSIHKAIADRVDQFVDDLTGQYKTELSGLSAGLQSELTQKKGKGGGMTAKYSSANLQKLAGEFGTTDRGVRDIGRDAAIKNPLQFAQTAAALYAAPMTMGQSLSGVRGGGLSDMLSVATRGIQSVFGEKQAGTALMEHVAKYDPSLVKKQGFVDMLRGTGGAKKGGMIGDRTMTGREVFFEDESAVQKAIKLTEGFETGEKGKELAAQMRQQDPKAFEKAQQKLGRILGSPAYENVKDDPVKARQFLEKHMKDELHPFGKNAAQALDAVSNASGYGHQTGMSALLKGYGEGAGDLKTAAKRREAAEKELAGQGIFKGELAYDAAAFTKEIKSGSALSKTLFMKEEKGELKWKTQEETNEAANILAKAGNLAAQGEKGRAGLEGMSEKEKAVLKQAGVLDPKTLVDNKEEGKRLRETSEVAKDVDASKAAKKLMAKSIDEGSVQGKTLLKQRADRITQQLDMGKLAQMGTSKDADVQKALALTREFGVGERTRKDDQGKETKETGVSAAAASLTELYEHLDKMGGKGATKAQKKARQQLLTDLPDEATAGYGMYKRYSKEAEGKFESKEAKAKGFQGFSLTDLGKKGVFGAEHEGKKFQTKEEYDKFLKERGAGGAAGLREGAGTASTAASEAQIREAMKNMLESQNKFNNTACESMKKAVEKIK